ncbi:uncharacterized protein CG7065 [Drosophila obscura]|uniref:uncharacterized protein CG7065 n=1 Tax=Drosophila obscura TaxID=7282 RepID=UPI001BB10585|nr:uncharacterized protein CG7065 [Drosophila obscura]
MSFLPGEPVPPGFEEDDSSVRPAVIQKQVEDFRRGPLIGTEYSVEIIEEGRLRPKYFCVLCNNFNELSTVFVHWTSVSHRSKYLQTHFQKAYEELEKIQKRTLTETGDLVIATGILCQHIEKHYGRARRIVSVLGAQFKQHRSKFCSQARDMYHFDECSGPDFVQEAQELVQDIKKREEKAGKNAPKKNERDEKKNNSSDFIALDAISSDDESFGPGTGPGSGPNQKQSIIDEQSHSGRGANRSPPAPGELPKQQLPTPKELSIQASIIAQERYKWEKFRCMLELQLKQLRDETETYESFPEKHPDYPDEWKQFWNRRYKQLQEEKKTDPNSYDYKPEWISYWKDRRVELFNIAVTKIKKELKDKFKLTDEDEEKTKDLMERYKIRVSSPREASAPASSGPHVRRKPNFRSNRGGGGDAAETVIELSDDEAPNPSTRNRAQYRRSRSQSKSPKRGFGGGGGRHPGRRSRSRSPRRHYSRHNDSRSPYSRSPQRGHRSRSPVYYHRRPMNHQGLSSNHGRSRDDYSDRRSGDPERDRDRERTSDADFYRSGSYSRTSHAPYERMETFRVMDSRVYPEYSLPKKTRSDSPANAKDKDTETSVADDGPLTVVSVLRMLSAVEDHLGSLGPKALSLLSKALAMEMVRANAADDLLLNEDNCVLLETIKEKLKGILIAEVLDDPQKVRVVKKLITNIAAIIFQVKAKAKNDGGNSKAASAIPPPPIPLPYDRQIIYSKLASALVVKGYYDVRTDDMDRLLHFYATLVKIERSRRVAGKKFNFSEVLNLLGLKKKKDKVVTDPIEIDIDELMKEVESQLHKKEKIETVVGPKSDSIGMESLTDSDLQTLLQNFKFLSSEEQVHLIGHLRKLEVQEPLRVECLRKYVNLAELSGDGESCSDFLSRVAGTINPENTSAVSAAVATVSLSNNSASAGGSAAAATAAALSSLNVRRRSFERELNLREGSKQRRLGRPSPGFLIDDDDDDDYNFDDLVMKACDSNGGGGGNGGASGRGTGLLSVVPVPSSPNALTFKPAAASKFSLDTESIIANLMDTLTNCQKQGGRGSVGGSSGSGVQQANREHPSGAGTPALGKTSRSAAKKQQQQLKQGFNKMGGPNANPMQQQQQQQQAGYNQQDVNSAFQMPSHHFGQDPSTNYNGGYSYPGYSNYQGPGQDMPPGYGGVPLNPWANNGAVPQPPPFIQQQNYMAAQQQQQQQQQQPHPSQQYNNMFGPRH